MSDIAERLRASVKWGAIHGDEFERSVCESQMLEAADRIDELERLVGRYL